MKTSKTLTSAVVAAAMVGGIGLAYAQTSDTGAGSGVAPGANPAFNSAPAATDMNAAPAVPSTDTTVQYETERPAQADRN
ncbi:MAG: hypothetical protein V4614_17045 [Pseudomonadota bacterium]